MNEQERIEAAAIAMACVAVQVMQLGISDPGLFGVVERLLQVTGPMWAGSIIDLLKEGKTDKAVEEVNIFVFCHPEYEEKVEEALKSMPVLLNIADAYREAVVEEILRRRQFVEAKYN